MNIRRAVLSVALLVTLAPTLPAQQRTSTGAPVFNQNLCRTALDITVKEAMGNAKWAEAVKEIEPCMKAVESLSPEERANPELRALLVKAYEYRGRARLNKGGELAKAREDFLELLNLEPSHQLTPPVSSGVSRCARKAAASLPPTSRGDR